MRQDIRSSVAWAGLSHAELTALRAALDVTIDFERGDVIAARGEDPFVGWVTGGHLCRRRTLRDGGRQLLPVAIAGDPYGALDLLPEPIDFDSVALSRGSIATAPVPAIIALVNEHPGIERALARARRLEETILRERVVNLGGRPALSRLAHLLCEFVTRAAPAGIAPGEAVFFPFNQNEIAQSCGLSAVHVNRVLKDLRARQLVKKRFERLFILDYAGLAHLADFDPNYLRSTEERGAEAEVSAHGPLMGRPLGAGERAYPPSGRSSAGCPPGSPSLHPRLKRRGF